MNTVTHRILMIAPTPFFSDRGTHIRIFGEAQALVRRGHSVTIATYHIGSAPPALDSPLFRIVRIPRLLFWYTKREAGPSWQKILLDLQLLFTVLGLIITTSPTVVHAHLHEGAAIARVARLVLFWKRPRLVIDLHGSLVEELDDHRFLRFNLLRAIARHVERRLNASGDVIITSSSVLSDAVAGVRVRGTTRTVTDGIAEGFFEPLQKEVAIVPRFDLPTDRLLVCYAGAFMSNKGFELLLDAARIVSQRNDAIHFVLAGGPSQTATRLVQERSLERAVTIVSPLQYEDLPYLLQKCDIGVDPKVETSHQASGKILQYMAAGLPVICSGRGSNRSLMKDVARYIVTMTPAALAEEITELAAHRQTLAQMGVRAKELALEHSWGKKVLQLEECYAG